MGLLGPAIHHYCGQYQPTPVMNDLKAIVGEKDYLSSHQTEKVTLNCVVSIRRKSMRSRATGLRCSVPAPPRHPLFKFRGGRKIIGC